MKLTYNKHEKLKSQKTIEKLFLEGQSVSAYPLRLVYMKHDESRKIGVSVSKRNFKLAVDRIRIKRLLRETYRLNKTMLINKEVNGYALMILYIGKDMPDFEFVNTKMKTVLTKFTDAISKP
ncbi:ribonuclease P protein component [Lacinutrix jangbogonensis]|uniref:ribonuclease P protein component n=1 Tax=Lacinutrix jangbogonensis TaxID=1469557 RepID=UPI00053DD404|nr:ribonuclease P protein component [Lacinutrix jangbogonensis]